MTLTLRALLCCSVLAATVAVARADGPDETPFFEETTADPIEENGGVYQPPPEGVCFDDENQSYDCSKDEDYQSYKNLDDGYDPSAYEDFREALSPYGEWVQSPQYGQVWVPSQSVVGTDFTPYYTGGRWTYTDYGWTWTSEHSWGWAPFHYGRWTVLPGYGWIWVPGRIWGPAWVHWRSGGGYVGWAPLPPRGMIVGRPVLGARVSPWIFVAAHEILFPRPVRLAAHVLGSIFGRTVIANDFRSIGTTRVIVGPPIHHFPRVRVVPTPLGSLHVSLPRAHIAIRPGLPLLQRPYYSPSRRVGWEAPIGPRPGYPPPYRNPPIYQPPTQTGPGLPPPRMPIEPGPGNDRPPVHRPPIFQRPGHDDPSFPHPTPEGRPTPPVFERPRPENRPVPPPVFHRPPAFQPPAHPSPSPTRVVPAPPPVGRPGPRRF